MLDPHRYYDNDVDSLDRYDRHRDAYASEGSQADDNRYYEQGRTYIFNNNSDADVYGQKYVPSTESLGPPRMGIFESSASVNTNGVREPYPAWSSECHIPLSEEEIEDVFLDLTQKFDFHRD